MWIDERWLNTILTGKVGDKIINCYDETISQDNLKRWSKKKIILCPACNKPYEYCCGRIMIPYFRHMDKADCNEKYQEPETLEHILGKRDLFEWIKQNLNIQNAVLEGWIPETKQRPDIIFEYKSKIYVIEYQCSPIASEYFERHELYQAAGIHDIWICGTEKYIGEGKMLNTLENACGTYYDYKTRMIYHADNMLERKFKYFVDAFDKLDFEKCKSFFKYNKKSFHLMLNSYDYLDCCNNYIKIKNSSVSYKKTDNFSSLIQQYHKFSTAINKYEYIGNKSFARCYLLDKARPILY